MMIEKIKRYIVGHSVVCLSMFFLMMYLPLNGQTYTGQTPVSISIPEVAVVDIEPDNSPISFSMTSPTSGGSSLLLATQNKSKWINYSCALSSFSTNRNIYIASTNGVPDGLSLKLTIGNAVGGRGKLGNSMGTISLSTTPQLIIADIGRGYTGNGTNAGHQLTYKLSISDYAKLAASESTSIQIMLTISE